MNRSPNPNQKIRPCCNQQEETNISTRGNDPAVEISYQKLDKIPGTCQGGKKKWLNMTVIAIVNAGAIVTVPKETV